MGAPLILAIDQGTSATKCLLVDRMGAVVARGSAALSESHPRPGWVDQDPAQIWASVRRAVAECLSGRDPGDVVGIGLSTQRESCVAWDPLSGEALTPVISWQDQRTAALCDGIRSSGAEPLIRETSGLPLDPMFSAVKAQWLLDQIDPRRERAAAGQICVGTVDAWLLGRFSSEPVIEAGNASRTQLLDTRRAAWSAELLALFDVPEAALPRVVGSTGPFPPARGLAPLPDGIPVLAVMGDSHAALFAHGAYEPGTVKATYGTGSSVMGLIDDVHALDPGLCLTIAWSIGKPSFACEGNIRAAGSTLRWLAGVLGVEPPELAEMARGADSAGVHLVPGFNGLGAPWWDRDAVGLLCGLTLSTSRAALARAALESIPHQVADVVEAVDRSVGRLRELHADGGPTKNDSLMQLQADFAARPVLRSDTAELSALGVAHLAGLEAGIWSWRDLAQLPRARDRFEPAMAAQARDAARRGWRAAVERARSGGALRSEASGARSNSVVFDMAD